jgi:hypothetical protein
MTLCPSRFTINNYKGGKNVGYKDVCLTREAIDAAALAAALDYPVLHFPFSKSLNEYINYCIKNREYIEAQKAKDKIYEAQQEIRKRNISDIDLREQRAVCLGPFR